MIVQKLILGLSLSGLALFAGDFTKSELESMYYADLGPASIDVSKYPPRQQERYAVFSRVCSQCHTLARAVNSPTTTRDMWEYYIFKMRFWTKFEHGTRYTKQEGQEILDFLVYDAQTRKIHDRVEFEALTRKLQNRFRETIEERMHRLQQNPPLPGMGNSGR